MKSLRFAFFFADKYLEECPQYQKYLADNIIHNTEYCIIFLNPNHKLPPQFLTELKNKKIPIPQSVFSRKKFKLSESHEHKRLISYLKEINYVCGEISIPPEGANYELFRRKEVPQIEQKYVKVALSLITTR